MAEGKNKILVYRDWLPLFEKLSDEEAGQLIKHFFRYVNDLEPEAPNRIIDISFEPIKQTLKRDLIKWESFTDKQSENGKLGGRPPKPKESQKTQAFLNKPKKAVSVSVNDSVNVKVNKEDSIAANAAALNEKKTLFVDELKTFSEKNGGKYASEMITNFFRYWTELNPSKTKMRFQLQKTWETKKRLVTWANREKIKPQINGTNEKPGTSAARTEALKNWGVTGIAKTSNPQTNDESWDQVCKHANR